METFDCFNEIEQWEKLFLKNSSYDSYEVDSPSDSGNVLTYSEDEVFSSNLSTPTYSTCGLRSLSVDDESSYDNMSDYSYKIEGEMSPKEEGYVSSPSSYSSETLEEPTKSSKRKRSSNQAPVHKDGFKWRKYGQKHIKGNIYPKNYYKCTVPDCPARKYIEILIDRDGVERENVEYVNEHIHPPPNSSKIIVTSQEELKFVVKTHSQMLYDKEVPKNYAVDDQRFIIECRGNINYGDDGYSWKKYGQKNIKGAFKPRQYYKCTHPKCTVKKQIESYSCTHMVITYDGKHDHLPKPETKSGKKAEKEKRSRKANKEDVDPIFDLFKPIDHTGSQVNHKELLNTNIVRQPLQYQVNNFQQSFQPLYFDDITPQQETDILLEDFGLIAPPSKKMNVTGSMNCYGQSCTLDYLCYN